MDWTKSTKSIHTEPKLVHHQKKTCPSIVSYPWLDCWCSMWLELMGLCWKVLQWERQDGWWWITGNIVSMTFRCSQDLKLLSRILIQLIATTVLSMLLPPLFSSFWSFWRGYWVTAHSYLTDEILFEISLWRGDSTKFQRLCQGNRVAPTGWAVISITTININAHKQKGHVGHFVCPI